MLDVVLSPTPCAICGTFENSVELYPARLPSETFSSQVFSARRAPDCVHYRIVRCRTCGLVRSDPVADAGTLATLYLTSHFDYADQVAHLQNTYGRYLARLDRFGLGKCNLLEVGCGNGFFLETALRHGYANVVGIEPSQEAVAHAAPHVRPHLVCDVLRPGLLNPASFDVVCLFQVLDHVSEPRVFLEECRRLLRPGGLILAFNHDVEACSARVLRDRSPIIDVEHTYLFSISTMRRLFELCGFHVREAGVGVNEYALRYLLRLLPLPRRLSAALGALAHHSTLGNVVLRMPLGNLFLIAQKPGKP